LTNTFDWNGDGKSDAFDHFMDMKVMSSSSEDSDNSFSDFDDESEQIRMITAMPILMRGDLSCLAL